MSKKDQLRMPTGMGGLVRYGEEAKDAIKIKPEHVVVFTMGLIVIEIILKLLA